MLSTKPKILTTSLSKLFNPLMTSKIASYYLGMYYDYELSLTDSAKYYYQFVSENFPSSSQAETANKRLEVLNAE